MTTEVENETLCAECTEQVNEEVQNDTTGFNCYLCGDVLCDKHQTRCRTCSTVYCAKSECMWRLNCVLCDTICCQVCCGVDDKNAFTFFRCPLCDHFRKRKDRLHHDEWNQGDRAQSHHRLPGDAAGKGLRNGTSNSPHIPANSIECRSPSRVFGGPCWLQTREFAGVEAECRSGPDKRGAETPHRSRARNAGRCRACRRRRRAGHGRASTAR